jgi:hypothetical protein
MNDGSTGDTKHAMVDCGAHNGAPVSIFELTSTNLYSMFCDCHRSTTQHLIWRLAQHSHNTAHTWMKSSLACVPCCITKTPAK